MVFRNSCYGDQRHSVDHAVKRAGAKQLSSVRVTGRDMRGRGTSRN